MNRTTVTLLAVSLLCGTSVSAMSQQAQNESCARLQQLAEQNRERFRTEWNKAARNVIRQGNSETCQCSVMDAERAVRQLDVRAAQEGQQQNQQAQTGQAHERLTAAQRQQAQQQQGTAGSDIIVSQPQPRVTVQQEAPQISVTQPQPQIIVRPAQPTVRVQMPQPNITIDQPQPEIIVRMPEPEVAVTTPEPQVTVTQADQSSVAVPAQRVSVVQDRRIIVRRLTEDELDELTEFQMSDAQPLQANLTVNLTGLR